MLVVPCFANDITFEITTDTNRIALGETMQLNLTLYGTQAVSAPSITEIEGFKVRYLGPSTRMSIVNGKVSSSITHVYTLLPIQIGEFQIGPLSIKFNGREYTSNSVMVEVFKGALPRQRRRSAGLDQATEELLERVSLVMEVEKKTAYVNELVPLKIKLFVNRLSIRDIQYPQFDHDGFSSGEFGKPEQYRKIVRGIPHEVLEFETTMFGTRSGDLKVGPAELKGNLVVPKQERRPRSRFSKYIDKDMFDDFFSRYETYPMRLKSAEIPITVLPLPSQGKPQDFKGAVGNFSFDVSADPGKVQVGDPVTLRMTIRGEGNFSTAGYPQFDPGDDFKVYDPQVIKQEDGIKVFEQVVIPNNVGVKEIPKITFSYFSTEKKIYRTIERGPFPIEVSKPDKEEQMKIVEMPEGASGPVRREILGRDIIYIKDSPGELLKKGDYLYKKGWFFPLQIMPLALLALIFVAWKRSDRLKSDIRYARKLRASKKARQGIRKVKRSFESDTPQKFYDEVFKTMQEYLGDKFQLPIGGITSQIVDQELKDRNINKDILSKLREVFSECDMARYALSQLDKNSMKLTFNKVREVIEYFERERI